MAYVTAPDDPGAPVLETEPEVLPFSNSGIAGVYPPDSPVAVHGKLKVVGTQLCDEKGSPVQLRGVMFRGLNYEAKFINRETIGYFAREWKIEVMRVAIWPQGARWGNVEEPGYVKNPGLEKYVEDAVRITEEYGIYCIIDWHNLLDGDPNAYREESRAFFKRMTFQYGAKKHVLYEICNEPNGERVTWARFIKPYALYVIPVIRAGDPDSIIIVGTERWSADTHHAAADPLKYKNIMYTFHFYAGTYPLQLTERLSASLKTIPIFCTEWGPTTSTDVCGAAFLDRTTPWMDFLDKKKISWCSYSLSDIRETTSLFRPDTKPSGEWDDSAFTPYGKYVRDRIRLHRLSLR